MAKKKTKTKKTPPTFEQALDELEAIVDELESGELGLDGALDCYQRGMQRLKQCHEQLEEAERRVALLSGVDADGNPVVEPFNDPSGGSLDEKAAARGKRRTRKTANTGGASEVDDPTSLF